MAQSVFLDQYPHLKTFLYEEPRPSLFMGFGVSPVSFVKSKIYLTANLFQLHYIKDNWDIEIISASIGKTIAQDSMAEANHFTIRTIPKFKVYGVLSIGPIFGLEFVRFPGIKSRIYKDSWATKIETFSTMGSIFGIALCETFKFKEKYLFKINQLVYKQTYSTTTTEDGWKYLLFDEDDYELENEEVLVTINSAVVYMLEFSILF